MRLSLRSFVIAGVIMLAMPLAALAAGDVQVSLSAHRVLKGPAGQERLASADHAKPGEVIEYQARYTNSGRSGVRQMVATLPIPAGTQYLPATAAPQAALASVDGQHFEAIPLKRRVRLADGSEVTRDVPFSEYRYLRWTLGDMPAGGSRTVTARVRVENGPLAVTTTDAQGTPTR